MCTKLLFNLSLILVFFSQQNYVKAQIIGQTNLLKNPDFESGLIPFNNNCNQGVEDGLMTDWITIPAYGFDKSSGTYRTFPYTTPTQCAVYDARANDCYYYYTNGNINYCNNAQCPGSRKIPYTQGGYRNTPNGSGRMIRIGCGQPATTTCDIPRRQAATGKLTTALNAGCLYTVKLKASLITENYCCQIGKPHNSKYPDWLVDNPFTKLVITLRKNGDPKIFKDFHTNIHINSTGWKDIEYQFTLCDQDGLVGYNQIEFRLEDIPTAIYKLNGKSIADYAKLAFIDDVKVLADVYTSPTIALNNTSINILTNWNSTNIVKLSGTITLNAALNISGAFVYMDKGAKIIVKNGAKLSITNGAHVEGQCGMWETISVEDGGEITTNGVFFADALCAIKAKGSNAKYSIVNSFFRRCVNGVELSGTNMTATKSSLTGNTFDGRQPIKNPCAQNAQARMGVIAKDGTDNTNLLTLGIQSSTNTISNTFIGLYYGVYVQAHSVELLSNRFEACQEGLNIKYCSADYTINVYQSNQFIENNYGIKSITSPEINLYIKNNLFRGNSTGILVQACQGIKVTIGGPNSGAGNFFSNNVVSIKLANNGFTSKTGSNIMGLTRFDINYNQFNYSPNGHGILIQEISKGSDPIYNKINVGFNHFTNIGTSLKCSNINGNKGEFYKFKSQAIINLTNFPTNNFTVFGSNTISYNLALNPTSIGVYNENCYAMQVSSNTISASRAYDWRNTGVHLQDCNNTLVQDNTFKRTGLGLHARYNMQKSNYYCNHFENTVNGIDLYMHLLRDRIEPLHGFIGAPGNKTRDNYHSGRAGWGTDILFGYSNPRDNQWLFQFKPPVILIRNELGKADNRMVDPNTGTLDCEGNKFTNTGSGIIIGDPFNSDSLSGALLFSTQYRNEALFNTLDSVAMGSVNPRIAAMITSENLFAAGLYDSARQTLAEIIPNDSFEAFYKIALELSFSTRPDPFTYSPLDSTNLDIARQLALKDAGLAGLGVYIARALISIQTGEDLRDPLPSKRLIAGRLLSEGDCLDSLNNLPVCLTDSDGHIYLESLTYTDAKGEFILYPGIESLLDQQLTYGFTIPFESKVSVYQTEFKPLSEWIGHTSDIPLKTLIASNDRLVWVYEHRLISFDGSGSVYEATNISESGQTDIQVSKIGTDNWVRHYRSAYRMDDSVFALVTDPQGAVYVAGMVTDSFGTKALVIKWNAGGQLAWSRLISDSLGRPLKGTGLSLQDDIVFVNCTGNNFRRGLCLSTCNGSPAESQSIPFGDNAPEAQTEIKSTDPAKDKYKLYPNPSKGEFTIELSSDTEAELELFNGSGVSISKYRLEPGINTIYSSLRSGYYFYTLRLSNGEILNGSIQVVE